MLTDIEISNKAVLKPIKEIAAKLNIEEDDIEYYGKYKAKISDKLYEKLLSKPDGKLILVTAINPTPAGEGKTTVTIGLGQALSKLNKNAVIALREPSLGPVMGLKGGATGGGYSQVVPMEDINLHFTGDMHALTSANNLISAVIDNHIYHGNELKIEPNSITWKRAVDLNDRALRQVEVALGDKNGVTRNDGFNITVASEIMAILCLAKDIEDLKGKVASIIVAYNIDGEPVKVKDLKIEGAVTALLKDAIKPNLVQTLENTPCIIHGGPFANIAHGCNSLMATKLSLKLADYVVTEAGFGADLGAEKFLDIKCRIGGLKPSAVVIVATIRSLKYNGGVDLKDLAEENIDALKIGVKNLEKHIENIKKYNLPVIVAVNRFYTDTQKEIDFLEDFCKMHDTQVSLTEVFAKGGEGGTDLAEKLIDVLDNKQSDFKLLYEDNLNLKNKFEIIAKEIYGAGSIIYTEEAEEEIKKIEKMGYEKLPVCVAKTQYSLSDDPKKLGRPEGFTMTVREVRLSAGAGFVVFITGSILTMPGLPKVPAAEKIDVMNNGKLTGIF